LERTAVKLNNYYFKDLPKGTLISILREAGITREEIEKILKKGKIK
jgi:DNA-binding transcriptional MerR regulator